MTSTPTPAGAANSSRPTRQRQPRPSSSWHRTGTTTSSGSVPPSTRTPRYPCWQPWLQTQTARYRTRPAIAWTCRQPRQRTPHPLCTGALPDEDEDSEDGESLSVYEAADIWHSRGEDEGYTFGYSEDELRRAADED